jgi:uncharacterized protein involved in outer membrane biogenesis
MPSAEPAPPIRSRPRSRRVRAALAALLLLALLVAAFDWTWFRPLIQHYIHERSGRRVDFDELHIGLDKALQPTVRLRNLVVQNAPWAGPQPLVRAAKFGFTLSWHSLGGEKVVLTRLELVDAELDLERQADGLRNWRLTRPDDRGPGRVRVMSIDARNTRARIVDQGIGLELELKATPLAAVVVLPAHTGLPLTRQVALHGTRDGVAFDAQLAVSDVPTFFDTGAPFAMRGELRAGPSHADVEGTLTDLLQLAQLDLDLRLAGPRVADLGRVLGVGLPVPPLPVTASAHLAKAGERWNVSTLRAKLGRSDIAGDVQFDRNKSGEGRSVLRAALTSERVNVADFRATPLSASAAAPSRIDAAPANPLDADIDLKIGAVDGLPLGPATRVSAHAALRDGRWAVDPAAFTIAGGRATGKLVAETARLPVAYALDMRVQGLQIDQLAHAAPQLQQLTGALDARIALRSRGDSLSSLAGAAAGSLQAELVRATIPATLDAKLGLDGGRLLRAKLGADDARTPITCSALDLRFDAGRGTVHRLAFDTPQVAMSGTGVGGRGRGRGDRLRTPRRKQAALLALDRALQVSGPFGAPKTALVAPDAARAGAPCVAGRAQ